MSNATRDILTPGYGGEDGPLPTLLSFPVAAATTIYVGTFCATNASGYAISTLTNASRLWGRVEKQVVNTTAAGYGNAGDLYVECKPGVFYLNNSSSYAITNAMRGSYCYAEDNNTVGYDSVGGSYPLAGWILDVPASGQPNYGKVAVAVGMANPYAVNPELAPTLAAAYTARNVATSLPGTFTVTSGVLQADANAALGAQDGVTNVAGDVIILPVGTVGSGTVSAANSGPWLLTNVGGASAKFAAVRPAWWANGASIVPGAGVRVGGEGTLWAGTFWKTFAAASATIGTSDPLFYPQSVTQQITLAAGTATISNVPIRSATKIGFSYGVAGGTPAGTTTAYQLKLSGGITAGALGTAAVVVEAQSVVGTKVNTDVAVLNVTLVQ